MKETVLEIETSIANTLAPYAESLGADPYTITRTGTSSTTLGSSWRTSFSTTSSAICRQPIAGAGHCVPSTVQLSIP